MRPGIHVGIHSQRHVRGAAHRGGEGGDALQLLGALDIDLSDAFRECETQLGDGLADARKHDIRRRDPGGAGAHQFARAHDIRARAGAAEHAQHRKVVVGLHRVVDVRGHASFIERAGERAEALAHEVG